MKKNLLQKQAYEKYWSVRLSPLTDSYLGYCYTRALAKTMGQGFPSAIIISRDGMSDCYFKTTDRKRYGANLIRRYGASIHTIRKFCSILKEKAHALTTFMHDHPAQHLDRRTFNQFLTLFYQYTGYHIGPRHMIDFLPPLKVQRFLADLKEVRIAVEHMYPDTEEYIRAFAETIAKRTTYTAPMILHATHNEFNYLLLTGTLPPKKTLSSRIGLTALIFTKTTHRVLTANNARAIEKTLNTVEPTDTLTGTIAYPGKAVGTVHVVLNPNETSTFKEGDILVTGMTRPDFIHLMRKAGAIVTDAGGMLCHAAITAREFKKPCIIGTRFASTAFKTGDCVEVDANNGIVKKI